MKYRKFSTFLAAALAVALAGCAQQHAAHGDSAAHQASAAAQQAPLVRRQAVAAALYELAYSARQNALFVASAGGFGENAPAARVLRLDPATLAVQGEIALERKGFGVTLDDAAGRLYVGNTNDASITVVDTTANKVIGVVQLAGKVVRQGPDGKEQQQYPHNFRELLLDKANHRLYAPGLWFDNSALYVVDTRTLKIEKVLPGFGFVSTGVALDEKAGRLYVSNLQGQLHTVDTRTLEIVGKAEIQADQPLNLAFDRKAGRILATDQGMQRLDGMRKQLGKLDYQNRGEGNRVVAVHPADGRLLASVPTGKGPVALLLDEKRNRLFVTNREAGTVTVHDRETLKLLHTFELPAHPNSLALDEKTGAVFVTVKNGEKDARGSSESVARIQF